MLIRRTRRLLIQKTGASDVALMTRSYAAMCLITDTMREGKERRPSLLGHPERPKTVSDDPTVLDYALIKSGSQHYSSSELIRTVFKAAEQEDWIALSDLIDNWTRYSGETISVLQWQRMLQVLAGTPVFLRYFDKYKAAGHEPGVAVYTCMMRWLIRQKRYSGLTACFESIREPTQSAYKTYLGGLLKSDDDSLLGRAEDILLKMMKEDVRLVDTPTCSFLIRKMTGDFKGCRKIFVAMQDSKIPLDESIVYSILRSVRSEEEYNWLISQGKEFMTSSTLSAVLSSPWSQCGSFDLPAVLRTFHDLRISPSSTLIRSLVHFCSDSETRMLQLFAHEWLDVDRRALSLALYQSKLFRGMQRPGPLEVAEHLISLALGESPDAVKTETATRLAIQMLGGYDRCSFELASKLSERLLFHGKAQLAADFILLFLEKTQSTVSTGTCNMILKRVHEYGLHDLGERITVALMQMRVPGLLASVRYGQSLFMAWFPVPEVEDIIDAPHLVSTAKSLCKLGKLKDALQVIEHFESRSVPLDEADERVIVLCKLSVLSKLSGERQMYLETLDRIKHLYGGPFTALCGYGRAVATGAKLPDTVAFTAGGPTENIRALTNIILQNAVAYRSLRTAKKVKQQLFSQVTPDLSTYKIYAFLMISHAHDRHEQGMPVPTELLEEILCTNLTPDMDVYSLLLEYAAALEDFDQISNVLGHLMERGVPDRRIFDQLFLWMHTKGDLQSCLDLYEMMTGKCGVMPSTTAHDMIVLKCLEVDELGGAREWLLKAATKRPSASVLESRCSERVVSQYFAQFYRVNTLEACQTELDTLFRAGYHVPGDFYLTFFQDAMDKGDVRSARRYLNRLVHQKNPPPVQTFLDLCDQLLLEGWIDDAHKVFSSIRSSQPDGWWEIEWKNFESYLACKLPEMITRQPSLLERLRPPKPGQNCYSAKYILDYVLRSKRPTTTLSKRWCQSVLANLISRGEFGIAGEFGMYMLTKGMSYGNNLAEEICGQWSALRAIVKPTPKDFKSCL